jgi:hypothetical protein
MERAEVSPQWGTVKALALAFGLTIGELGMEVDKESRRARRKRP